MIFNNNEIHENEQKHDLIADVYDTKHTEIYNFREQERLRKIISELIELTSKKNEISVLDFGAGTGNLSLKFLNFQCRVTACDVSEKSLNVLKKKSKNHKNLITQKINGDKLPFPDNSFDIISTYSVLHHIPDYLSAVKEMIRVCKPGGLVYIDHEANKNHWNPSQELSEWYKISNQTHFEHLLQLLKTRELFSFSFLKTIFYKLFVNRRYEREGDIHIWADDHILWDKIKEVFSENNCETVKEENYLLFKLKGQKYYEKYKNNCTDTKLLICRKL
jgi:ubiquinone/menaquinone biosynthesis C-methylase UbiE